MRIITPDSFEELLELLRAEGQAVSAMPSAQGADARTLVQLVGDLGKREARMRQILDALLKDEQ